MVPGSPPTAIAGLQLDAAAMTVSNPSFSSFQRKKPMGNRRFSTGELVQVIEQIAGDADHPAGSLETGTRGDQPDKFMRQVHVGQLQGPGHNAAGGKLPRSRADSIFARPGCCTARFSQLQILAYILPMSNQAFDSVPELQRAEDQRAEGKRWGRPRLEIRRSSPRRPDCSCSEKRNERCTEGC